MNEETKQENVIPLSRAKSFSKSSAQAFSVMSTLQKITKRRGSRDTEPSQGRGHTRPRELRVPLSQMSLMGDHPSQTGTRRGLVEAKLVQTILEDIGQIKDVYARHRRSEAVLAIETVMDLIKEEYLD